MNLSGLVAVSGKPGLFKVVGQSKAGFILQHLEDFSSRIVVNSNARLASLDETTVYGSDSDLPLKEILIKMQQSSQSTAVPEIKADSKAQRAYFSELVPEHDHERVYASDIKKIISWYRMLEKLPLFTEADPRDTKDSEPVVEPVEDTAVNPTAESAPSPEAETAVSSAKPSGEKKP